MRLLNDQVQICHNEVWGYVCENSDWTDNDATVVCRELGLSPQGGRILCSTHVSNFIIVIIFTDAEGSSRFLGSLHTLSGPHCSGLEERLIDCPLSEIENISLCFHTSVVHCAGIY